MKLEIRAVQNYIVILTAKCQQWKLVWLHDINGQAALKVLTFQFSPYTQDRQLFQQFTLMSYHVYLKALVTCLYVHEKFTYYNQKF